MANSAFTIAGGRSVVFPSDDWVVVNPDDAPSAMTVCVVAVRNAPAGTPHFAVFVDRPVRELHRHPDLDTIDAAIIEVWPAYQDILDARVAPVFKQGLILENFEEWNNAPQPGYFDLDAWSEYWIC